MALVHAKETGSRRALRQIGQHQTKTLTKFSDAIRGDLKKIDRLKIVALVTIEIHARDVIAAMYKSSERHVAGLSL